MIPPYDAARRYIELTEELAGIEADRERAKSELVLWSRRTGQRHVELDGLRLRVAPHKGGQWAVTVLDSRPKPLDL